MTKEKILEKVYAIQNAEGALQRFAFNELITELKEDITAEEAKKCGRNNQLKAMKAVLKNNERDIFKYAKTIGGKQYVCNGYILIKVETPYDLPECPENFNYLNVSNLLNDNVRNFTKSLEIPDISQLKAYVKTQKAKKKAEKDRCKAIIYNFGKNMPAVNAECLAIAMDVMIGRYNVLFQSENNIIYFVDEHNNEVILCPLRKNSSDIANEKTEI